MSLQTSTFKSNLANRLQPAIINHFDYMQTQAKTMTEESQWTALLQEFARRLANSIAEIVSSEADSWVKTGDVQTGITVQTSDAQGGTNVGVTTSIGKVL